MSDPPDEDDSETAIPPVDFQMFTEPYDLARDRAQQGETR